MTRSSPTLCEPLLFTRIFLEKVWGGRALERTPGFTLPGTGPIGETWELVDRADYNSVVSGGALDGRTLRDLMQSDRRALLGAARTARDGSFPLLVKFLDASESLSVQVHPHASQARELPQGDGSKTECWYILAAEPKSAIYLGLKPGVDAQQFARAAAGPKVVDLLVRHEVVAGQFVFVPGGTVHAIGAGIALVEVQETSDTTYRLYDWGRMGLDGKPRPVHIEPALRAIRFGHPIDEPLTPHFDAVQRPGAFRRAQLVECDEFALDLLAIDDSFEDDTHDRALIYIALAGRGTISLDGSDERWPLRPGDTRLVPACAGRHRIEAQGALRILQVRTKS